MKKEERIINKILPYLVSAGLTEKDLGSFMGAFKSPDCLFNFLMKAEEESFNKFDAISKPYYERLMGICIPLDAVIIVRGKVHGTRICSKLDKDQLIDFLTETIEVVNSPSTERVNVKGEIEIRD